MPLTYEVKLRATFGVQEILHLYCDNVTNSNGHPQYMTNFGEPVLLYRILSFPANLKSLITPVCILALFHPMYT